MNKMFAIVKREYLMAVRRKMFIIMTLLIPFLMAALIFVPSLIMARGMGQKRIAILDGTGKLATAFERPNEAEPVKDPKGEAQKAMTGSGRRGPTLPSQIRVEYVNQEGRNADSEAKPYLTRLTRDDDAADKLEGVFVIPASAVADPEAKFKYYSRSSTDLMTQERLARLTNRSLQTMKLRANGIRPELVEDLLQDLPVDAVQMSRSGDQKKGGELNFIVAFLFGALLILPSTIYGQEIMRGIVQEKTERVVEVLISSVSPIQLLTGKIVGIAMVGLTQILVWVIMIGLVGAFGAAAAAVADVNLTQFLKPVTFLYFIVFFILAYMNFVCIYAIAGAVSNTDREAQQFVMPLMMIMMMPWFLMMPIVLNADSPFAVAFSIAPVFGPITMFVRTLVTDPPVWHILLSMVVSVATIAAFLWVTAKIFRVGILSYGKRPTLPELLRWIRVA